LKNYQQELQGFRSISFIDLNSDVSRNQTI